MAGQPMLKQLRAEVRRLRIQNNALRIVMQGVADNFRCNDEGEQEEDAHGGDWESCWKCQATRALERPGDFRHPAQPVKGTPGG